VVKKVKWSFVVKKVKWSFVVKKVKWSSVVKKPECHTGPSHAQLDTQSNPP